MIEVQSLTKRYGEVLAVNDISFRVDDGEVVGFLGPNGAGKSTTLRILTAYMPATQGSVRVAGFDVLTRSLEVRKRLGYLPETVPLYPDMRVEEFLRFRAMLKGVGRRDVKASVDAALDRCGCTEMRRRMITTLSKGYRQRVGIADAIVHDPPILILDEPTSGLDPNQRVEVRRLIKDLGESKTVLLSSHILAEVEAVAERVIIVRRGEIRADGPPAELVDRILGGRRVVVEARGDRVGLEGAMNALAGARVVEPSYEDGVWRAEIECDDLEDRRAEIGRAVQATGAELLELSAATRTLETIFHQLTVDEEAHAS